MYLLPTRCAPDDATGAATTERPRTPPVGDTAVRPDGRRGTRCAGDLAHALRPDAPPVAVEAAALVDDYACGYGFAKGNPEQTFGLVIYFGGGYVSDGPDVSTPIELASDDRYAAIRIGDDLFANWCDDVLEPGEPTPIIDETWNLVGGTLTVTPPTPADCGGDGATATLVGAVAESEDGERITLDDIALINRGWGCFAG